MSAGTLEEGRVGEREVAGERGDGEERGGVEETPGLIPTAQNWVVGVASVQYWNDLRKRKRRRKHV